MRIAITGANGLLGQELTKHSQALPNCDVFPLSHRDLDITRPEMIREVFDRIQPDTIINAAVIVSIEQCEADPARAFAVNRDGVRSLMETASALSSPATFIQISSSEVFGGWEDGEFKVEGYREGDERRPVSVYQKSKKEAEDIVTEFGAANAGRFRNWYIVRASWLFGEGRKTFVEQFVELVRKPDPITVAFDQWRSPTWTRDFAASLAFLIANAPPSGIYHIANEVRPGEATVMDVISEIRSYFSISEADVHLNLVSRKDFFKIPRAPSNVLLNTKLPRLRPWREALGEYLRERYPRV